VISSVTLNLLTTVGDSAVTKRAEPQSWRSYEDAFRSIVAQHQRVFGLESVEPAARHTQGASGHVWDIEVIGYTSGQRKMVIFEVRKKSRNIEPEAAAGLAYRIDDTGSDKGYFVTSLGRTLSKGARKIADFNEIGHIQLSVDSTPENYVMKYLNDFFVGLTSKMATLKGELSYELRDKDGNVVIKGKA
jgi:hypothetical protein